MEPITFLAALTAGTLGIGVLAKLARDAREYRDRVKQELSKPSPKPLYGKIVGPRPPHTSSVPERFTAGYWWRRLFSPLGMLGLLILPTQGYFLLVNSELLAMTFETILDRTPEALFIITILGWEREVTNYDLYGALISLAQMGAAAIVHITWEERKDHHKLPFWLGAASLTALMAYEVGASIYRALKIEGSLWNAALSGILAFGFGTVEAASGIPILGTFLIPLLLAILWTLAAPFRWIAQRRGRRPRMIRYSFRDGQRNWLRKAAMVVVYPLAVLDQSIMVPLHKLDDVVSTTVSSLARRVQQGGHRHAEPSTSNPLDSVHMSDNGHDSAGVRMDRKDAAQVNDRVVHRD